MSWEANEFQFRIAFVARPAIQFPFMKKLTLVFAVAIASIVLNSCASNKETTTTTTTTTMAPHQQGTGLPSQQPQSHGM